MKRKSYLRIGFVSWAAVFIFGLMAFSPLPLCADTLDDQVKDAVSEGQEFLYNNFHDEGDGTGYYWNSDWMDRYELAATAAAVSALIETGMYSDADYKSQIDKAIEYIKNYQQTDGGIYQASKYTYQTGMALIALSLYDTVNPQPQSFIDDYIQPAVDYLLDGQYPDGSWSYSPANQWTGEGSTGDLSNTQFAIMGLYYAYYYVYGGKPPTNTADSWAYKLREYVESVQVDDEQDNDFGVFAYTTSKYSYKMASMNGAGLWTLAMLGIDREDEAVANAIGWFDRNYTWDAVASDSSYYYAVYAMAKALTGLIPSDYAFPTANTGNSWTTDLKQTMVDNKSETGDGTCYWSSGKSLDAGKIINTSWVLMSLAFADISTESPTKRLPDIQEPDYPVKGEFVSLEAKDGVTISGAVRGRIDQNNAVKPLNVGLPIGSFAFTLNNVDVGGTAVLKIAPPAGALDPENPDSFINADGTIKAGLSWFKIRGGEWKALSGVPIKLVPEGGPYTAIEITLTDGGPEDESGAKNGMIIDPGAPGYGAESDGDGDGKDGGDSSSGCFINTAAPGR